MSTMIDLNNRARQLDLDGGYEEGYPPEIVIGFREIIHDLADQHGTGIRPAIEQNETTDLNRYRDEIIRIALVASGHNPTQHQFIYNPDEILDESGVSDYARTLITREVTGELDALLNEIALLGKTEREERIKSSLDNPEEFLPEDI